MCFTLSVESGDGTVRAVSLQGEETVLVFADEYAEGDRIVLSVSGEGAACPAYAIIQLDDAMPPALVYLSGPLFRFPVPFGERKICYSPRAYSGRLHYLHARLATPGEVGFRRNVALNPYDIHGSSSLYPHATANVETRGESIFAARNAIDGWKANAMHGEWPYTSWGINRDPNARLRIEFGRSVRVDSAVFYLRADFPHDAWWESATIGFSDGSSVVASLRKTGDAQPVSFPPRSVEWVTIDALVKADDPSPFPALTQIEFWGS